MRKRLIGVLIGLIGLGLSTPAYADASDVTAARSLYKTTVAAAEKAKKISISRANAEYRLALRSASEQVAVANAQAKALAVQATRTSAAKANLDRAFAAAGSDRKAQTKALQEYDKELERIKRDTEEALKNARALSSGKSTREQARFLRDQAIKTAQETFTSALADARAKLNAVLVANGFPAEKG